MDDDIGYHHKLFLTILFLRLKFAKINNNNIVRIMLQLIFLKLRIRLQSIIS